MEWVVLALLICMVLLVINAIVFVLLLRRLREYPAVVPRAQLPMYRKVFRAAAKEFGVLPAWAEGPMAAHRYDGHLYASFFAMFRDTYLGSGLALSRQEREIVATALAVSNRCYFCVHVHANMVRSTEPGLDELILDRRPEDIADPRERALVTYGLSTKDPNAPIIGAPPFTREEVSDAAVLALCFHYMCRILDSVGTREGVKRVILTHPPGFVWPQILGLRKTFEPGLGLNSVLAAGGTLPIQLDDRDRDTILRITIGRQEIADTFLFAWSSIQHTAREQFSPSVLSAIRDHLTQWHGERTPMGTGWADEAVVGLARDPQAQALARQGVIIARDAFMVSREELWRVCGKNQRRQLALSAYASMAAALRIVEWLPIPGHSQHATHMSRVG